MSELQRQAPSIFIDGKPAPDGRSRQREDGSYSAYDLAEAQPGDVITLITTTGAHDLMKDSNEGALHGWRRTDGERALGSALKLALLEANPKGASILTAGVVVRENLEISAVETDPEVPHEVKNLGAVASILTQQQQSIETPRKAYSS